MRTIDAELLELYVHNLVDMAKKELENYDIKNAEQQHSYLRWVAVLWDRQLFEQDIKYKFPTVDAVEVIRCSKCKYFCSMKELDKDGNITMEYGACMREPGYFPSVVSDDYCSKAERREDDENREQENS